MRLIPYLTGRFFHSVLVFLCVSFLAIALVKCTPGDYFDLARVDPRISQDALSAMRSEQGLDRALPVLYWKWISSVPRGEWGYSFAYNTPAFPVLFPRALNTLLLAITSTCFAWIIALLLGVTSGIAPRSTVAWLTSLLVVGLLALPELVTALGVLLVAARMNLLKTMLSTEAGHLASRLLIPTLCLGTSLVPLLVSHVRASVRETSEMPFVAAARGWGMSEARLVWCWILPASLNSIISLGGLSIGLLMSSSFIVEAVFNWPGLGLMMLQAIRDRDIFLIVDAAIIAAGFLVLGNVVADALLYLSDPRIRTH